VEETGGLSSEVPNDGNLSMLPSFANTDALSSSRIRQLPIACQPLAPSIDPVSESSRLSLASHILYRCMSFLSCSALNHSSQKLAHTHTPLKQDTGTSHMIFLWQGRRLIHGSSIDP